MKYNLNICFATKILILDLSENFKDDEIKFMTDHIDNMIENKIDLEIKETIPLYQSKPILFHEKSPNLFSEKLLNLFLQGCNLYLENVKNFCRNQKSIFFTQANSWFYCGWPDLNKTQDNPWHAHSPAFLSGIFYLKNSGNPYTTGTEFHDPRGPWTHTSESSFTLGNQGHLVIFPGWLYHKPMNDPDNKEKRYTVACDVYAAV
jgi:hypothetical protein